MKTPTLQQLQSRLAKAEEAYRKECDKNTRAFANTGWGTSMRCVKVGPSCKREDQLRDKIRNYKKMIANGEYN